jgi:Family of unknown function (DUF5947)
VTGGAGALDRVIKRSVRPRQAPEERCELCGAPVGAGHRHVLETDRQELRCACTACSLLFDQDGAAGGRYRLVPDRRVRLDGEELLGRLDVPVGLAYFVKSTTEGRVVARYPSPMGATHWELDVTTWAALEAGLPRLRELRPDVEALLVNTVRGARECWIVPVDDCYRLVALLRREWRGLSGGSRVWEEVGAFFAGLRPSGR